MKQFNIDFVGKRHIATAISVIFILASLVDFFWDGLNFGLDFTGGTLVEVQFPEPIDTAEVRQHLDEAGLEGGVVQYLGSQREVLVRLPPQDEEGEQVDMGDDIVAALQEAVPGAVMLQSNYVGPAVGEELRYDAVLALLAAFAMVMVYIVIRFTNQLAVGAVVALVHDVIVVIGCFSLFQWTFDLSVLAAVLAVVGYSINDTIVIFDRVRENFRKMRRASTLEVFNRSINETLDRTLITAFTTLLVLGALLFAGGETIRGFALALSIGVVVGCYSTVYAASNVAIMMGISREDLLVPEKEGDTEGVP